MTPTALPDTPAARATRAPGTPPPAPTGTADPEVGEAEGLYVSEETYWQQYYLGADRPYEWNNGRLETKPVSDLATWQVYLWLLELLRHYLRSQPIAQEVGLDMGFRLALSGATVIRRPDLGVVRHDNPVALGLLDQSYHGIYDLCVEALSDRTPEGITRDLVVKKAQYAAAGVPEYFILHHEPRYQAFYRRGPDGLYAPIAPVDGVIRSRVLPGWQFRLTDLIDRPAPWALYRDPVYSGFVLPELLALEQRAAAQTARAEREAAARRDATARADAEAARAEAEAAARQDAIARAEAAERELATLRAQLQRGD